jgi:hypothetical protein
MKGDPGQPENSYQLARRDVDKAQRDLAQGDHGISDEKRLRKVFKAMRGYGDHLQYSVFECQLTPMALARCRNAGNFGMPDRALD